MKTLFSWIIGAYLMLAVFGWLVVTFLEWNNRTIPLDETNYFLEVLQEQLEWTKSLLKL